MENKLIDNALDFLELAAKQFSDPDLNEYQQLKHSTINLYEGIELILKSRLVQEHWSLIIRDPGKYLAGKFEKGDFVSTSYGESVKRLASFCGIHLEKNTISSFDKLRLLRNRYVHFHCDEPRENVASVLLISWNHVLEYLREKGLVRLSESQMEKLEEISTMMHKVRDFLYEKYNKVKQMLDKRVLDGLLIAICPICQFPSMVIGDGLPNCPVCESLGDDTTEIADMYAESVIYTWKHPKHGVDDEVYWCSECNIQAVVPADTGLIKESTKQLAQRGSDGDYELEHIICLSCGIVPDIEDFRSCSYCGAKYFSSNWEDPCPECDLAV